MSSIIHLPGMRFIRDGQIEELDDAQLKDKTAILSQQQSQQWKQDDKLGFYQNTSDYYESLLRNRSYLEPNAGALPPPNHQHHHYDFSPQQVYPPYFTTTTVQQQQLEQQQQQQQQQQQMDLQKRPIRKRRRPPHSYASLIAQAILTSRDQRLTLREIYEWVQTRYPHLYEANETGWQNTIRHNLSLNRCFRKLPRLSQDNAGKGKGSKGGYWAVDLEQLNNTNFGRQILDSGFLGNIEYWHQQHQQQQQQQQQQHHHQQQQPTPQQSSQQLQHHPTSQTHQQAQQRPLPSQQDIVDEIDFNTLVAPFYPSASTIPTQQEDHRYTTEVDDNVRMASFLARFNNKRSMSSLGSMTSSKTSSVRGSTSPHSPATTDMETPILSSAQLQQQYHQKIEMDPLLNPSLMRVNNILN